MITAKDLIVSAECVETGQRLIGYVCCCKFCQKARENETYDKSRPIGHLTSPDGLNGGIRVYTDNMEFVNAKELEEYLETCKRLDHLLHWY